MRLTLRTLLAWMDRVLAPEDQRDLGEKVATSGVAPRLADRVRAAVAHPRLAAPKPDGHGLADDPNTAAEYLDNVLAADRLEVFERICIESDVHLAEVASCHGILAEITRGVADDERIDEAARRRLLAAMTTKAAMLGVDVAAAVAPQAPPRPSAAGKSAAVVDDSSARPAANAAKAPREKPMRRRRPLAAWLAAGVAVLLLVALGGVFAWSLARTSGGRREVATVTDSEKPKPSQPGGVMPAAPAADAPVVPRADATARPEMPAASAGGESAETAATPAAQPPAGAAPGPPEPPTPPPGAAVDSSSATPQPPAQPPPAVAAVPPADATTSPPPGIAAPPPPPASQGPLGDALVIVAPPPRAPANEPPGAAALAAAAAVAPAVPPPAAAAIEPPQAPAAGRASPGDVLLRRTAGEPPSPWQMLAEGEVPGEGDELLAPPWCHPQFAYGDVMLRLEPNTRAVLVRDSDGTPRLEVVFGRAVAWSETTDATLGVTAGGLVGVATAGPRRPIGIELDLDREPGSDPATRESRRRALLVTSVGEAAWKQTAGDGGPADDPLAGIGPETMLPARGAVRWTGDEPGVAEVGPAPADAGWVRGAAVADRTQRAAADALTARLAAGGPLEQALIAMAVEPRAENRMIAVATLALLGEYEPLVAQLAEESPRGMLYEGQWKELEAMTVPLALARGANAAGRLADAFTARGPDRNGELLVTLARGMTAEAFADGGAATLVDALDAESLVVRRYAILRLLEAAGGDVKTRSAYRADRPAALRREGVAWWRSQLEQGRIGPPR
jgi:hypothetical protein